MERDTAAYNRIRNKRTGSVESLCSFCGNACRNGCSWAEDFTPVKGWEAIENKNGWFVVDCPEYCDDKWMREHSEDLDTEGCIRLMEAFIRMMRDDYIWSRNSRLPIERFIRDKRNRHLFFFADPEDIIAQFRKEIRHTT